MSTTALEKQLCDKLLLDSLDLIEQYVTCKVDIEETMNAGQLQMAKARYIQGAQSVAQSKLPTENSADFNALKTVKRSDLATACNTTDDIFELETHPIDKETDYIDPLRWFGILVPRSLQLAQEHFNRAIRLSVECTNIHVKLQKTMKFFAVLTNKSE